MTDWEACPCRGDHAREKYGHQQGTCGLIFPLIGSESGAWKYKSKAKGKYAFQKKKTLDWLLCFASCKGMRIPESCALEYAIQPKEYGIPLTIGLRNLSSTDKESGIQCPESGIESVESRIQDSSWIPLHGAMCSLTSKAYLVRFKIKTKLKDFWTSWVQAEPASKTLDPLVRLQQGTSEYCFKPLFQTRLSAKPLIFNDMKRVFHFHANKAHFHTMKKGFAFGVARARQRRNPCSGSSAVYQDLSTRYS